MAEVDEHNTSFNSSESVISIKGLHKAFGDNKVINGFNFDLKRGENVVVLGKSGSGKSVLIKLIIGLMKPDQGTIEVLNDKVTLRNYELKKRSARELPKRAIPLTLPF